MALQGDAAKALEAVKAGKDPMAEVYGETLGGDSDRVIEADEVQPLDTNSTLDSLFPSNTEEGEDAELSQTSDEVADDQEEDLDGEAPASDAVETLTVTDDKGRRKVKVDFNNREQLKKYVRMAHGMRKFQAERDADREKLKSFEGLDPEKTRETVGHWKSVEGAYSKNGVAGLVDLIEGREGAFEDFKQSIIDNHEIRRNATPRELELLDAKDREESRNRELEQIRRENEEFRKSVTSERETAELRSVEAKVHPVFDKYRFADQLGNPDDEHMFDEMLWNSALKKLESFEDEGVELSPSMIERSFRDTANAIRRRIKTQAEKTVKKAVKQKKREATENAQQKVMKGFQSNSTAEQARDLLNGPNSGVKDILQNWGKFKNVFNK